MRCCLLLLLAAPLAAADRLDQVRTAVRSSSSSSTSSGSSWSSGGSSRSSCHEDSPSFLALFFGGSDGDCEETSSAPRLRDPPELRSAGSGDPPEVDSFASAEGGYRDDLARFGARLGFTSGQGAMEAGVDRYDERFDHTADRWDHLDLWRLDGSLTIASSRNAALRLGLAGLVMHDPYGNDLGIAADAGFHLGNFSWCPRLEADALAELGVVGHAGIFHARGELGYRFGALEPLVGYDYLLIERVALQGPFAGLRWHF
jgi:hypothetical protein